MFKSTIHGLTPSQRHKYILQNYVIGGKRVKRDIDVIREHHRFLWEDDEDSDPDAVDSWERKLARKYYDKLFKEYCIADLSRYKENKIALRWRTKDEVIEGIGQFQCGSRKCTEKEELRTWEMNFAYMEQGERKNALVKIRLCPEHSMQLNYTSRKREIKRAKVEQKYKTKDEERQRKEMKKNKKHKGATAVGGEAEAAEYQNESGESPKETITDTSALENIQTTSTTTSLTDKTDAESVESQNIWAKKLDIELEPTSREAEFEQYLIDLLI